MLDGMSKVKGIVLLIARITWGNYMSQVGITLIFVFFILSIIANIGLVIYIRKIVKDPGEKTYDVINLMQDLVNGGGLIKIERIDPQDFLLRSPRHRQ